MEKHDKAEMAADKKLIKKAIAMHDKQEHKGGKGTNLSKLKKGGVTGADLRKYGRNVARAMNQRGSSRGG